MGSVVVQLLASGRVKLDIDSEPSASLTFGIVHRADRLTLSDPVKLAILAVKPKLAIGSKLDGRFLAARSHESNLAAFRVDGNNLAVNACLLTARERDSGNDHESEHEGAPLKMTYQYFSVAEVARQLACSDDLIRKLISRGKLEASRVGGVLRISSAAVERLLAAGRVGAPPPVLAGKQGRTRGYKYFSTAVQSPSKCE